MKRFPELKPNFWDVIVVLAVIALAALSAMTVWRGGTETGALTAVVTADGQEIDRFAPADLLDAPRTYSYNGVTLTVAAEDVPPVLDALHQAGEDAYVMGRIVSGSGVSFR